MVRDEVKAAGQVLVEFLNESGEVVDSQLLQNKVVGLGYLAQLLAGEGPGVMTYMAMGAGTAGTTAGYTRLDSETARVALSYRYRNGNGTVFIATFPAGAGTGTLGELGIFNADGPNAGVMLARVTASSAQPKEASTSIRVTWTITFS